eukprot:CAMPEP_0194715500 /NCGR_PEP_ID=MMETSP0296-20130528/7257_1 /TAXON_ID=39354 /ORGANISM="Heterosigma akashiwo, Strain CCMP2393" /LENGTH=167 /DNA_ID=CAMNT_0039615397 /DNA_START=53 /DNA_END=556 /DNA_ORIENTATION=-
MAEFYPKLIIYQIISLQCFYYLGMGLWLLACYVIFGSLLEIGQFFSYKRAIGACSTWEGWNLMLTYLVSNGFVSLLLVLVVGKAKKCMDFGATLFLVHLLVCSMYGGFPVSWEWWIPNLIGITVAITLGEYLCSRQELKEIPLFSGLGSGGSSSVTDGSMNSSSINS